LDRFTHIHGLWPPPYRQAAARLTMLAVAGGYGGVPKCREETPLRWLAGIRERLTRRGRREQKGQEMTSATTGQPTHRSQTPGSTGLQRVVHLLQTSVVNPLIRLAFRIGIPDPGDAVIETTGRRTGKPQLTPVCDGLEGDTFWLLSQRGRDAHWVRNIESDPRVRVKLRSRRPTKWRSGTAYIVDDDDPNERQRILSRGKPWRRLCLSTSGALATDLLTVRVDLDP
jgi:deazaflavin-dependent oxidoreductase (nitroreductase family)